MITSLDNEDEDEDQNEEEDNEEDNNEKMDFFIYLVCITWIWNMRIRNMEDKEDEDKEMFEILGVHERNYEHED